MKICETFACDSARWTPGEEEKDKGVEQNASKALGVCGSEQADAKHGMLPPPTSSSLTKHILNANISQVFQRIFSSSFPR